MKAFSMFEVVMFDKVSARKVSVKPPHVWGPTLDDMFATHLFEGPARKVSVKFPHVWGTYLQSLNTLESA